MSESAICSGAVHNRWHGCAHSRAGPVAHSQPRAAAYAAAAGAPAEAGAPCTAAARGTDR